MDFLSLRVRIELYGKRGTDWVNLKISDILRELIAIFFHLLSSSMSKERNHLFAGIENLKGK